MRCPACSSENPPDWTACESCGAARPAASGLRPAGKRAGSGSDDNYAATAVKAGAQLGVDEPMKHLPSGEVLVDRFELKSELGRGGSGLVYRAWDRELRMDVAVKLLQPGFTRDPTAVERLKREIIAARRITHRNVIRINEFVLGDKESFVAMEYLTGGSLTEVLEEGDGAIAIGRGVQIAIGLCEGLAAAHAVGVIHRDVKPDNVLFDGAGIPKLMDFGLARLSETSGLTVGFSGTPFYMSPEQGEGREITPKSDVYSTGVLLFQLFTGTLPFDADSLVRIAVLHAKQAPPSPRSRRADIPPALEAIILHTLAKDPDSRPTATELVHSLFEISAMLGDSVSLPRAPLSPPESPVAVVTLPPPQPPRPDRRRVWIALLVLLVPALFALPFASKVLFSVPVEPLASPTAATTAVVEIIELPASVAPSTATPAPTPERTEVALAPTPTATLRTVLTPVPGTPTPPPIAMGRLSVKAFPSVEVWVDGKRMWTTPVKSQPLPAGTHVLRFRNDALAYNVEKSVTIKANADTSLKVDTETGKIDVN
jgi:serine/threonine protein kinase